VLAHTPGKAQAHKAAHTSGTTYETEQAHVYLDGIQAMAARSIPDGLPSLERFLHWNRSFFGNTILISLHMYV
jgi:hypothetical protein